MNKSKYVDPYPNEKDKAFPASARFDLNNLTDSPTDAITALQQGISLLCVHHPAQSGFYLNMVYAIRDGFLLEMLVCGDRNLELMNVMCASDEEYARYVRDEIFPMHDAIYLDHSRIVDISKVHYPAKTYPFDLESLLK